MYVESFGNPRRFGRLARRVARTKPILALKSGTTATGQRAASSHTAALAGSETAVDALFRQAGVIRAASLEELVDVATLLSSQPEPRGSRVAILTNAGGLGILCADACEAAGLDLPRARRRRRATALAGLLSPEASVDNPVDMLGGATAATYAGGAPAPARRAAGRRRRSCSSSRPSPRPPTRWRRPSTPPSGASRRDKPVLAVVLSAGGIPARLRRDGARVAAFHYPESAARALGRLARRAEWLRKPHGSVPALDRVDRQAAERIVERALAEADDVWLDPAEHARAPARLRTPARPRAPGRRPRRGRRRSRGARVPGRRQDGGSRRAQDRARRDRARPRRRRRRPRGGRADRRPAARAADGAASGAELLAGVVQDPVFGPLVAFGPGGVFAELIGEASFRIAPLTDHDAEELVAGGKAGRLVRGFRGAPAADAACARRPRAQAGPSGRGSPGGRRARPEPGARAP